MKALDAHVAAFAEDLEFDLEGRKLVLEDIWINILPEGGIHTSHIHPHSVISGTTYVQVPPGAAVDQAGGPAPRDDDGRAEPQKGVPRGVAAFVYPGPAEGDVLLWESWLRHEVPMNMDEDDRVSVSFNYRWGRLERPRLSRQPVGKGGLLHVPCGQILHHPYAFQRIWAHLQPVEIAGR